MMEIKKVIVAVNLQKLSAENALKALEQSVATAVSFAQKLKISLRLVYVFEPTHAVPWGSPLGMSEEEISSELAHTSRANAFQSLHLLRKKSIDASIKYLDNMVKKLPADVNGSGVVLEDTNAASALIAEAISQKANFIIVANWEQTNRFSLTGLSTSLSLMANSPVPTLVIPTEGALDFMKLPLKTIVADDCREESAKAMSKGLEICQFLGCSSVVHTHVVEEFASKLKSFLRALGQDDSMDANDSNQNNNVASTTQNIEKALHKRAQQVPGLFQSKEVKYSSKVLFGDVSEKIGQLVTEVEANLIIFGKHQALHMQPYFIGKVPFHTMIQLKKPVLVCPT
jgi:nucleotide-binding universal stress UspA family protein